MTGFDRLFEECEKSLIFYSIHLTSLRKNIDLQDNTKKLLLEINPETDLSDFNEMEKFNDYNAYITIAMLDLAVNLKNLVKSNLDWEKAFFIKNSFLTIYEIAKKLKPFKGKSFVQQAIESNYQELTKDLTDLNQEIDNFRNKPLYEKIKATRHNIAGHVDDSVKLYYDTVIQLDGEEAGNLISEFMKILNKALNLTKNFAIIANTKQIEKSDAIDQLVLTKLEEIANLIKK